MDGSSTVADVRGGVNAVLHGGAAVTNDVTLGPVISLDGVNDYVVLGDFKGSFKRTSLI